MPTVVRGEPETVTPSPPAVGWPSRRAYRGLVSILRPVGRMGGARYLIFAGWCVASWCGFEPQGEIVHTQKTRSVTKSEDGNRPHELKLIETWVDEHADYLFGHALTRLRDRHVAEEVHQETFLAALKSVGKFRGDSSPRTWLVGLLRRKIADHYRKRYREGEGKSIDATDLTIDAWFDENGSWIVQPKRCEMDPAELQQRADFRTVLQSCLKSLPDRLAEAFVLRVVDDWKPDEVCKVLSITPTNLWVALHRARARLRACLEANWFESDGPGEEG